MVSKKKVKERKKITNEKNMVKIIKKVNRIMKVPSASLMFCEKKNPVCAAYLTLHSVAW